MNSPLPPLRPAPRRPGWRHALLLAGTLLLGSHGSHASAAAQHAESLLLPRGSLLLEARGVFTQAHERIGTDGRVDMAGGRFDLSLGETVGADEAHRLRLLLEDSSAEMNGGRFVGRFEANDQYVPLRLGYGVLDRVTVGVTVPLVRRRIDALLHPSAAGANLGLNPALDGRQAEVAAFLAGARSALLTLQNAVAERCQAEGESSPACQEGRATEGRVAAFVDGLDGAWDELRLFPVEGTGLGNSLASRWNGVRGDLESWGATGAPASLPLAAVPSPATMEAHRTEWLTAVWPQGGFPYTSPDTEYALGDMQAHLVVGLTGRPGEAAPGGDGVRVRSAVELSLRFATGAVDSFAVAIPTETLSGHGGFGVRWVTDLLLGDRAGLLVDLGWESFQDADGILVGAHPQSGWIGFMTRAQGSGHPGDRLRVAFSPRVILGGGVSLGAGYEALRTGEARWSFRPVEGDTWPIVDGTGPSPTAARTLEGWTAHRASVELRFAGWDAPVLENLPFPVEVGIRGSRTLGGSEGTPVQSRLELSARIQRRR